MKLATLLLLVAALTGLSLATPNYHRFKYAPYYCGLKYARVQEKIPTVSAIDQEYGNKVWVSICNAMLKTGDAIQPGTPCSVIATLSVATILTKCPIVAHLHREFLQQRLNHLQQICHTAIPDKHLANFQWDKQARDQLESTIPVEHIGVCSVLSNGDESTAIYLLDLLCEHIDKRERPTTDTMMGGDRAVPPPDVDRMTETHWGLCVSEAPDDRLEVLCLAIKKGFMECPSSDVPLCSKYYQMTP